MTHKPAATCLVSGHQPVGNTWPDCSSSSVVPVMSAVNSIVYTYHDRYARHGNVYELCQCRKVLSSACGSDILTVLRATIAQAQN
eukprot:6199525-Pleurochrysis_carterae.AAC.4